MSCTRSWHSEFLRPWLGSRFALSCPPRATRYWPTRTFFFFLSPVGLLALVVLSALSLAIVALEQACLMTVHANLATPHFIRRAHRRGKEVFVWTINDPSQMSRMISRGVDSLITDQPALGRAVIQQRAEMNVVERLLLELSLWLGAESRQPGPETDAG